VTVPVASARSRTRWIAVRGGALQGTVTSTSIPRPGRVLLCVSHSWACETHLVVPLLLFRSFPQRRANSPAGTSLPSWLSQHRVILSPGPTRARMHPTGTGCSSSRSLSRIRISDRFIRIALDPTGELARLAASQRAAGLGIRRCASASIQSW